MSTLAATSNKSEKNQFKAINELRNKCEALVQKSYSLNQAVKALQGIAEEEELNALGLASFALANVKAAWSPELRIVGEEGKESLALFIDTPVTVAVAAEDKNGEPTTKDVRVYERTTNKKGAVKFKSLKKRVLTVPEKWTPSVIVEGLVQSRELQLAKLEAEVSVMHAENVLRGTYYFKVTEEDSEGTKTIRFEAQA